MMNPESGLDDEQYGIEVGAIIAHIEALVARYSESLMHLVLDSVWNWSVSEERFQDLACYLKILNRQQS